MTEEITLVKHVKVTIASYNMGEEYQTTFKDFTEQVTEKDILNMVKDFNSSLADIRVRQEEYFQVVYN